MPHSIDAFDYTIRTLNEDHSIVIVDSATADTDLVFYVPYEDAIPFQAALLGLPSHLNNPPYVGARREPHPHPRLPALVCNWTKSRPFGKPTGAGLREVPTWEKAEVVARYGVPLRTILTVDPPNVEDIPFKDFMQEARSVSSEFINAGVGQFRWAPNPNTPNVLGDHIEEDVPLIVPFSEVTYTIDNVVYIRWSEFEKYGAIINSDIFANTAPELMLFLGIETNRARDISGFKPSQIALRFKKRRISWNKFYRPDAIPQFNTNTDEFYTEFWQYTDPPLYQSVSFQNLFGPNNIKVKL